jgi:hypothetical protein
VRRPVWSPVMGDPRGLPVPVTLSLNGHRQTGAALYTAGVNRPAPGD